MISFTPTDEQNLISETVKRYASERLRPAAHDADESRTLPTALVHKGWELGLLPSAIPETYGGFGDHSAVTSVLAAEALAYGDLSGALYLLAPHSFALPLLKFGTDDQKTTWLPQLADADFASFSAALIEPRWDFDPQNLSTVATRQDDRFVLSGRKAFVPLAADAKALLVYAKLDTTTQAFIVERGTPGLKVLDREKNMGIRALPTYEVQLDDVSLPLSAQLGGETGIQFDLLLNYSRVSLAALGAGMARAAYEYARDYAKTREAFGRPVAQFQAIAFMLAEMAIEVEAINSMALEAAWQLDKGQDATRSAVLAKHYADDAVLFVTDRAVQVLGGHGYIREHPVERWLRDGRGFSSFLGLAMV
jgi:alkylation response protein AidB-like acyl-CoA dehydrogenase